MHDYSECQTIRYLGMHMCLYGANTLNMNEPIKAGALVNTKTHKHIQQSFIQSSTTQCVVHMSKEKQTNKKAQQSRCAIEKKKNIVNYIKTRTKQKQQQRRKHENFSFSHTSQSIQICINKECIHVVHIGPQCGILQRKSTTITGRQL